MPNPEYLFGPVPHQEAIDFIKSKPVVAQRVMAGLLPELRGRAFSIAGVEGANVLQAVRDRIADLPAGGDWNEIKKDLVNDISPFLVDPHETDPEKRDAQIAAANRRAEILLRTHGFQAYQAAEYQVMDRQRDVMPFWQYQTMEDSAVRPEHAALDQLVLPADSPFWHTHFPPWDWGCRCQVIPISRDDRDDIKREDAERAPDAKLVMEGPQLTHLEHGTLVRSGRTYDVRPPLEKEGGSGFSWDPSTLKLPLEQLKARYDEATWSEFEAWAKQMPMGDNLPTVWDWLTTGNIKPLPVAPKPIATKHTPPPLPPPLPKPGLDQFIAQHTALPGQMTEAEATNIIAALKQPHGIPLSSRATIVTSLGPVWTQTVRDISQRFFDLIPADVLTALPAFKLKIKAKMSASTLGEYDPNKHELNLNAGELGARGIAQIERTVFHELAHWIHIEGAKSNLPELVAYAQTILDHFNRRTAGEHTAQLPNYGHGAIGKKDKFWDSYMGREYRGIIDGSEIPTRVFELLIEPRKLSDLWNLTKHRETIKAGLSILFP